MTVEANPVDPAVGANVIITVRAAGVPASTSWNTFLRFDPAKVQLTAQSGAASGQAGEFLPDTRSLSEINASGEVRAFGSQLGAGFLGSGILGVFTFTAATAGTIDLGSEAFSPTNVFGTKFIKNGVSTIPNIGPAVRVTIGGGTVNVAPTITTQPANQTVSAGQTATFTVAASGNPAPTVQWQRSNDGATWNPIAGATALTYTTAATMSGDHSAQFHCVATNSVGTATSNAAVLSVNVAPTITTQPVNQTVTAGQTATFTVAASGNPAPTVQWQRSNDGATWNPIAGATALTYTTAATMSGDHSAQFRCVAINIVGTATSNAATLTVNVTPVNVAPTITTQPVSQMVTAGQTATFTVATSGTPAPTIQWQRSNDGITWIPITGATAVTFTTAATVNGDHGAQFRCLATNTAGTATSNVAILTVNPLGVAPTITGQPVDQSVSVGQTATFTVSAIGSPPPTFQWQRSQDGATWDPIAGATASTYTTAITVGGDTGAKFRCVAINLAGAVHSATATLMVGTDGGNGGKSGGGGSCGLGGGLGLLGLALVMFWRGRLNLRLG